MKQGKVKREWLCKVKEETVGLRSMPKKKQKKTKERAITKECKKCTRGGGWTL
jgi:hypothetical protein